MVPEEFFAHVRALHPEARLATLAAAVSLAHSPREAAPFARELLDLARTPHGPPRRSLPALLRSIASHVPATASATTNIRARALAVILGHWRLLTEDLRSDLMGNLADVVSLLPIAIESILADARNAPETNQSESLALAMKDLDLSEHLDTGPVHSDLARAHLNASLLGLLALPHSDRVRVAASQTAFSFIHRALTSGQMKSQELQLTTAQSDFLYQVLANAHVSTLKPLIELALIAFSTPNLSPVLQTNHASHLAQLAEHNEPFRRALCSVISWSKVPCVTQWAVRFLVCPVLAHAAARRLSSFSDQPLAARIQALSKDHLLLRPVRQSALLGTSSSKTTAIPQLTSQPTSPFTLDEVRALPQDAKSLLGPLLTHLAIPAPTKAPLLRALLTDPSPAARFSAMLASPLESLPDWCFDPHPVIARSATLRYLDYSKTPSATLLANLSRSQHDAVALLAQIAMAAATSNRNTNSQSSVASAQSMLPTAGQLIATANSDPAAAQRMLASIHRVGCASDYVEPLLVIAQVEPTLKISAQDRASSHLKATAISLLGEVKSIASFDRAQCLAEWIVRDTLPSDPRATANAIDAIDRMNRRGESIPSPLNARIREVATNADHPLAQNHRVRASAIRASCSITEPRGEPSTSSLAITSALTSAVAMLNDPRPGHAIAGAWLSGLLARMNARLNTRGFNQADDSIHDPALSTHIQSLLKNLTGEDFPSQLRLRANVSLLLWKHLSPSALPLPLKLPENPSSTETTPVAHAA